jgi:hypothetical protein
MMVTLEVFAVSTVIFAWICFWVRKSIEDDWSVTLCMVMGLGVPMTALVVTALRMSQ